MVRCLDVWSISTFSVLWASKINKELCNNQKLEPEFHLKQLFTTYHDNPISKLYISLRSLSYKHLVLIRNMVLTSPFVCDKKFNEIILAFSSKLIKPKKQVKAEKIAFIVPYLNKLRMK